MTSAINTAVKGKEYPPFAVTVERSRIKEFARAIGDLNPLYLDDDVGRASEFGDIIAPPTFPVTFRHESSDSAAALRDLGVDISRVLHGEQEFEHFRPAIDDERPRGREIARARSRHLTTNHEENPHERSARSHRRSGDDRHP